MGGLENYPPYIAAVLEKSAEVNLYFTIQGKNSRLIPFIFIISWRFYMEEWKNIRGNPNYIVSNTGRVRRKGNNKDHSMRDTKGYLTTDLYRNGKRKKARVHRLVAEEFVSNPYNKPEVNHKDGDKHNNNASNLEWVTKKEKL